MGCSNIVGSVSVTAVTFGATQTENSTFRKNALFNFQVILNQTAFFRYGNFVHFGKFEKATDQFRKFYQIHLRSYQVTLIDVILDSRQELNTKCGFICDRKAFSSNSIIFFCCSILKVFRIKSFSANKPTTQWEAPKHHSAQHLYHNRCHHRKESQSALLLDSVFALQHIAVRWQLIEVKLFGSCFLPFFEVATNGTRKALLPLLPPKSIDPIWIQPAIVFEVKRTGVSSEIGWPLKCIESKYKPQKLALYFEVLGMVAMPKSVARNNWSPNAEIPFTFLDKSPSASETLYWNLYSPFSLK